MKGRAIAIGASGDGIEAIAHVLRQLPAGFKAPVFITQHVGRTSSGFLPMILGRATTLPVMHPREGQRIENGTVYVAPPDHHLLVRGDVMHLSRGPEENHCRPSVDVLFRSVALEYGAAAVGVVLTGYLSDGTVGLLAIKDLGGVTIVQDPDEAAVPSMSLSALAKVRIDHVCRLDQIAPLLIELVADAPGITRSSPTLAIEDRIAGADTRPADLERLLDGTLRDSRCTVCGRILHLLGEPRVVRHRCEAGHAFATVGQPSGERFGPDAPTAARS
jgi:two-component system chemotaxis response regulator CheB